ncbi:MAG: GNAT family N-acetyltransferase [Acidobacteria bacterium]|nr:GNAT family N-acetyltransferase [Acidobacteriota bacterium]
MPIRLLYGIDEAHWGRGYAAEAARAIVDYGFVQLGCEQIVASTDVPNLASIRVMEKLGLTFQRRALVEGKDTVFYELTRN